MSHFLCLDETEREIHSVKVESFFENSYRTTLEDDGVKFITPEDLSIRALSSSAKLIGMEPPVSCLEKIYYRSNEFNALPANHPVIENVKELARALHSAGVCELPVAKNISSLGIENSDDVLQQFLCISNSESVFGTRNIGMGGRGPWGIHPMHNQRAGTRAFVNSKTTTLKKNGACYPGQAVVRDANGVEIKESNRYLNAGVRQDNASCAMILYKQSNGRGGIKGFQDWGTTNAWGSNRHCTKNMRTNMEFTKHIGELACCSQACKNRVSSRVSL